MQNISITTQHNLLVMIFLIVLFILTQFNFLTADLMLTISLLSLPLFKFRSGLQDKLWFKAILLLAVVLQLIF